MAAQYNFTEVFTLLFFTAARNGLFLGAVVLI